MADNKKYYYIRLKESFFDSNEIVLLESMPDGYLYSNILLKLYLRSLKDNGKLMFNDRIPYNTNMIATITRHQVGTVEKALKIFKDMGLIEILDNGAIYMLDIQNYIGKSSTEADRKRLYERDIKENGMLLKSDNVRNLGKISEKSTPEIEIEIDIEKETDIKKEKYKKEKSVSNIPLVELPLQDGSAYVVYRHDAEEWKELYKGVDVEIELSKMKGWLLANASKRKTKRGIKKFINGWLSRSVDVNRKKEEVKTSSFNITKFDV